MPPGPPRINIRWTSDTTDQTRAAAEGELRLMSPIWREGRTWSYVLLDTSDDHVRQVIQHPAVEDRAYIGPGNTLTPDAPWLRAWFQARYGRAPVRWLAASWWFIGPVLCFAGVLGLWPSVRTWSAATDLRVAAVLIVAAALRVRLIVSGGQFYWPDEEQYRGARVLLAALTGNREALNDVLRAPAALMLKAVGAVPAVVEALTGENAHVPALFFGSCSIVCIWLLAAIARRLGASRDEQFLAALLGAGSIVLFYMSRHLLSYDLALMLGLFGMYVGVRRPLAPFASVLTGLWSVAAFFAYAGAWPLAGAVCAIHVLDAPTVRDAIRRALLVAAGVAPIVVAMMLGYEAAGLSWVDLLRGFAGTITQGEFAEGWVLPFAYLWYAEHLLLIGWTAAVVWCVWRFRVAVQTRLTRAGLIGVICVYVSLAASSTLLHRFVVYGRLTRPLVPFLCLLTAAMLGTVLMRIAVPRRRIALPLVVVCVVAQAAYNFRIPLQQEYPAGFIARIERGYSGPHAFVNARHLYPGPEPVRVPPGYREAASARHPLQFLPYQYEGFTERERQVLRSTDIRMRVFVPAP